MADETPRKTRTLLFAISFPDMFDPEEQDPEDIADELVSIINEERRRNWPEKGRANDVSVSGIPPAVWMTSRTITELRVAHERGKADAAAGYRIIGPEDEEGLVERIVAALDADAIAETGETYLDHYRSDDVARIAVRALLQGEET